MASFCVLLYVCSMSNDLMHELVLEFACVLKLEFRNRFKFFHSRSKKGSFHKE